MTQNPPPQPSPARGEGEKENSLPLDAGGRGAGGERAIDANEFASPACSAHEMDPAYMWAERRGGWLARAFSLLRRRRMPR